MGDYIGVTQGTGHPFYAKLNALFHEFDFDVWAEGRCAAYHADRIGRSRSAPGVYFRMRMIGYRERLDSQREIAWHCADSRSLAVCKVDDTDRRDIFAPAAARAAA